MAQIRAKREASERLGSTLLTPQSLPHAPPPLQPKLTIGQSGDQDEPEADRAARQGVDHKNAPPPIQVKAQMVQPRDALTHWVEPGSYQIQAKSDFSLVNTHRSDQSLQKQLIASAAAPLAVFGPIGIGVALTVTTDAQTKTYEANDIVMMKRTGNTDSYQEKYTTANFGEFKKVTYRRDGKGNITFSKTKSHKVWKDPIKPSTHVRLNKGMKNKKYGIMSGGQKVKLATASRAQHFAIGDKVCSWAKNNRAGKWTWHHLSKEYEMVLVDMRVHAKHGHNGGVLLWK